MEKKCKELVWENQLQILITLEAIGGVGIGENVKIEGDWH